MTNDDERKRILSNIKLGLVRFWIAKGSTSAVTVSVPTPENEEEEVEQIDPWNYWVFSVGARGFFNGQETNNRSDLNVNLSANRVTENNKFSLRFNIRRE